MSIVKFMCVIGRNEFRETLKKSSQFSIKYRECSSSSPAESPPSAVKEKSEGFKRKPFQVIPIETSLRYMASNGYKETYGDNPVWFTYKRNHKGQLPPRKTREKCVRSGIISTGNPCPICRDEYLILHEKNVSLLKQFLSEHTGQILEYSKTGLCQQKHKQLLIAIARARDQGLLTFDVPFREYDYSEYMGQLTTA